MDTIDYELNEDDLVEFAVANLRTSPAFSRATRILVALGCALIILLVAVLLLAGGEPWVAGLLLLLGLPTMILLVPRLGWQRMPKVIRRNVRTGANRALLGPQTLELREDGVRRRHEAAESKISWQAVEKLICSRKYLALFITTAQAFVVPRRAFATADTEARFRSRAEELSGRRFIETPY